MRARLRELRLYLRGWMEYFCLEQRISLARGLDKWLRRRVRRVLLDQLALTTHSTAKVKSPWAFRMKKRTPLPTVAKAPGVSR